MKRAWTTTEKQWKKDWRETGKSDKDGKKKGGKKGKKGKKGDAKGKGRGKGRGDGGKGARTKPKCWHAKKRDECPFGKECTFAHDDDEDGKRQEWRQKKRGREEDAKSPKDQPEKKKPRPEIPR